MLEAKPLTLLWKHLNCLKWGETGIAVFRQHVPLHTIFSSKGFFADRAEPTHVNSSGAKCRLRKRQNFAHLYRFSGHKILLLSSPKTTTTTTTTFLLFYFAPPPPHFYCFPPPPLPLHFCCFPSTTTTTTFIVSSTTTTTATTFLLFSLHHHHQHISIVFFPPPPRPPPHFNYYKICPICDHQIPEGRNYTKEGFRRCHDCWAVTHKNAKALETNFYFPSKEENEDED